MQYEIQLVPVNKNGITKEEIEIIRNTLSDLIDEPRIQLAFVNAIIDAKI